MVFFHSISVADKLAHQGRATYSRPTLTLFHEWGVSVSPLYFPIALYRFAWAGTALPFRAATCLTGESVAGFHKIGAIKYPFVVGIKSSHAIGYSLPLVCWVERDTQPGEVQTLKIAYACNRSCYLSKVLRRLIGGGLNLGGQFRRAWRSSYCQRL